MGVSVIGWYGGSIIIGCIVIGFEVNKIQWMKYINNVLENIIINDGKYFGGFVFIEVLIIYILNVNDVVY